jgi:predicted aldo/keto reductase-like oxidoreductase
MVKIAEQIAGKDGRESHGFRFIQLPYNLAMPEAYALPNQACSGKAFSTLDAAKSLGVTVMASASILQGKLAAGIPQNIVESMGNPATEALASIQFVRSTPGVNTALIGMSRARHVEENLALVNIEPAGMEIIQGLFEQS